MTKQTEVVILGAGPVGLFTAFYCGMRQLDCIVVDQLEEIGGQLTALYPSKEIYDIAGFDSITAEELVKNLRKQIERFDSSTEFLMSTTVEGIDKQEERKFIVKTSNGDIEAKAVIIAGGNGAFKPRLLGVDNESELTNISYSISNTEKYRDKNVVVFGGGDSAVDFTMLLKDIANEVHIVHRRDAFRAHEHSVDEMKKSKIQVHTPFNIKEVRDDGKTVVINNKDEERELSVDNIICNFGFVSNIGPILDFGLDIEKNKIVVDSTQQTNIEGVFAIGDICTYPGKSALIAVGFGEGPNAVNAAFEYANPGKKAGVLHSSSVIGGH